MPGGDIILLRILPRHFIAPRERSLQAIVGAV